MKTESQLDDAERIEIGDRIALELKQKQQRSRTSKECLGFWIVAEKRLAD